MVRTRAAGREAGVDRTRAATAPVVSCGFCGAEFVEDPVQAACQSCPLSRGCGLMRCPHCGYENPKEPSWLGKLRRWIP